MSYNQTAMHTAKSSSFGTGVGQLGISSARAKAEDRVHVHLRVQRPDDAEQDPLLRLLP